MRLFSFLFLFVFIQSSCRNGTPDLRNEKEVRKALSNKWQTVYIEASGKRIKIPDAQTEVVTINENGTFSAGAKGKLPTQNGLWYYDAKRRMLYRGEGNEKGPAKILKLTDKELILTEYLLMNGRIKDSIIMTYNKQ